MVVATELTVLEVARQATKAGIVVLPAKENGSKTPDLPSWSEYQQRPPTADVLKGWFVDRDRAGLGFVCGKVSGGLEMLEFEDQRIYEDFLDLATEAELRDLVERIRAGYEERTPGGGYHWLYRFDEPDPNTNLASMPCPGAPACTKHVAGKKHVRIETRGEGGWTVVAPSHGPVHETGRAYTLLSGGVERIVTLTANERRDLWNIARALDAMPEVEVKPIPKRDPSEPTGDRPGDHYNAEATWTEILVPHGWARVFQRGELTYWRRPGKNHGVSATTGRRNPADPDSDYLWVFSTSVSEFETDEGYSKFRAYARLNHGEDYASAARELSAQGYGRYDVPVVIVSRQPEPQEAPEEVPENPEVPTQEPAPYRFEPVFPADHFVGRYVAYASQKSDAAHEYHEAIACLLLGAATPGVRAKLSAWPNGLATNLYVVLVGDSTRSRKSTAINEGKALLRAVSEMSVFPDRFSTEALLEQLAMRPAQPSVWFPDEFGQVLEDAEQKPLLKDALLTLYDSPPTYDYARHSKRVKGGEVQADHDRVVDPHWSVLGATTEAVFDALTSRAIQSGLLPRFAYIYPQSRPPRKGLQETTPRMAAEFEELRAYLSRLHNWAQVVDDPYVTFTPGTIQIIDEFMYEVEESGQTIAARLPVMAVKLAMLSAIGEVPPTGTEIVIEPQDATRAVALARKWHEYALNFGSEVGGFNAHERQFQQRVDRALNFINRHEERRASRASIMRHIRIPARDLDELERYLQESGSISVEVEESAGGRPPKFWRAL